MIVATPGVTPNATPVAGSISAILVLLLLQAPPGVASDNGSVTPPHTVLLPEIGAGSGLTVKLSVAVQPAGSV